MRLFTCAVGGVGATTPLVRHPCAVAMRALDEAGHAYEHEKVGGFKGIPLSRRGRREEIRALSGQDDVPLLDLGGGEVVCGTRAIVAWAAAHPAG